MRNRFKGIRSDRVPEELWMGVCDIIQEAEIKTIPKKKKSKKEKSLSEEAWQIAEKRREGKGKGEKERYIHLNAELQRIARRDKKTFLSDQCKEIEENNRMGKSRELFKKISGTKGTFHPKQWHPTPALLPGKSHGRRSLVVAKSWTRLSDFTFTFHFHALEKEMATHSSVLAWRISGTGEPRGLPSMGSHRVGHDWSDLAVAALSAKKSCLCPHKVLNKIW